ncbi:MAG: adenosine kinase [Pseudomonadota bacterium]
MTNAAFDVVGVGNAIVDIISRCDDDFLTAHNAPKGHMRLIDRPTADALYDAMGPAIEISGGSAANTIAGIASFGGDAAFIGKVAGDDFGRIFRHDLEAAGVRFATAPNTSGLEPTARSLILVTPDGERTMNTFLGISPYLEAADLDRDTLENGRIVYLEGYLFDRDDAKTAFYQAARATRAARGRVALTLSDGFCVDRHRDAFRQIIETDIDILFANESEILSLFQVDDFETAFERCANLVSTLAATRSEKGSRLKFNADVVDIPAEPGVTVVDATGAGDLYASGVLIGLSRNQSITTCGRLGSLAAAEVISHYGARPETNLKQLAHKAGIEI